MEVVRDVLGIVETPQQSTASHQERPFSSPEILLVQDREEPELIIVMDAGRDMVPVGPSGVPSELLQCCYYCSYVLLQSLYGPLRLSLEHFFVSLPPNTRLAVVSQMRGQSLNATILSDVSEERLASVHFPVNLVDNAGETTNLGWAFARVEEQVWQKCLPKSVNS